MPQQFRVGKKMGRDNGEMKAAAALIHFCHGRGWGAARGRQAGGSGARSRGGGLAFGQKKEKGSWASAGLKRCAGR
jgi:hypothetical protein